MDDSIKGRGSIHLMHPPISSDTYLPDRASQTWVPEINLHINHGSIHILFTDKLEHYFYQKAQTL